MIIEKGDVVSVHSQLGVVRQIVQNANGASLILVDFKGGSETFNSDDNNLKLHCRIEFGNAYSVGHRLYQNYTLIFSDGDIRNGRIDRGSPRDPLFFATLRRDIRDKLIANDI